jgi:hypothetical protein
VGATSQSDGEQGAQSDRYAPHELHAVLLPMLCPTPSWGTTGTIGGHPSGGQAPLSGYGKERRDLAGPRCFPCGLSGDKMSG